jgi:hypothetical protein
MGFIHTKLRNLLSPNSVEKLVFIKTNLPTFYDYDYAVPTSTIAAATAKGICRWATREQQMSMRNLWSAPKCLVLV